MPVRTFLRPWRGATLLLMLALVLGFSPAARALTHESPEVRQAVERAKAYLLKTLVPAADTNVVQGAGHALGMEALLALALIKADASLKDHPKVQLAASNVRAAITSGRIGVGYESVYNTGVAIVFLSALDNAAYRNDIAAAVKLLLQMQVSSGGFAGRKTGGPSWPNGDTSMTQYAVLGMWEASRAGVAVPASAWQNVTNWLLQTQQSNGTFLYNHPNASPTTHSMTAGGVGTLYICANLARSSGGAVKSKDGAGKKNESDLPPGFTPVGGKKEKEKEKEAGAAGRVTVDLPRLEAALSRGDAWLEQNFTVKPTQWGHYYLYALERYHAFRDAWERTDPAEPDWYTQGATHLIATQERDGSWQGQFSQPISTAFAVLFLVRASRTMPPRQEGKAGGILLSGSGLPSDLSQIRLKGGNVVVKALSGPAAEMLEILENPDDPKFLQALERIDELLITPDDAMIAPHVLRLKKLLKSNSPDARAAAVRWLGNKRDLDFVPTFIYALGDNNPDVIAAAHDALRFVSRKVDGFGYKAEEPKDEKTKAARAKIIEKWKEWYRSIRPDAEFEN